MGFLQQNIEEMEICCVRMLLSVSLLALAGIVDMLLSAITVQNVPTSSM
jgi:hypothetical protein